MLAQAQQPSPKSPFFTAWAQRKALQWLHLANTDNCILAHIHRSKHQLLLLLTACMRLMRPAEVRVRCFLRTGSKLTLITWSHVQTVN